MSIFEFETRPDYKPTVIDRVRDVIGNALEPIYHGRETSFDSQALLYPWDDDIRDALRMEIEEKPREVDTGALVGEAYNRLSQLFGQPKLNKSQVQKRVIFADQKVLQAFRHIYQYPGENSDKYWEKPFKTMKSKEGVLEAVRVLLSAGFTVPAMGLVFIPNGSFKLLDPNKNKYIPSHRSEEEYKDKDVKSTLVHELAHLLYTDKPGMRTIFTEAMADYIVGQVFPGYSLI